MSLHNIDQGFSLKSHRLHSLDSGFTAALIGTSDWFSDNFYRHDQTGSGVLPVAILDVRNNRAAIDAGGGLAAALETDWLQMDAAGTDRYYWSAAGVPTQIAGSTDLLETYYDPDNTDGQGVVGTTRRLWSPARNNLRHNEITNALTPNTNWIAGGGITKNSATSWGIFTDACRVESGGATSDMLATAASSSTNNNTDFCIDVYYAAGDSGRIRIEIDDGTAIAVYTGAVGSLAETSAPTNFSYQAANSWGEVNIDSGGNYRFRIYGRNDSGSTQTYVVSVGPDSTTSTEDVIIYGLQMTRGTTSKIHPSNHSGGSDTASLFVDAGSTFTGDSKYTFKTAIVDLLETACSVVIRGSFAGFNFKPIMAYTSDVVENFNTGTSFRNDAGAALKTFSYTDAAHRRCSFKGIGYVTDWAANQRRACAQGGTVVTGTETITAPSGDTWSLGDSNFCWYLEEIIVWPGDIGSTNLQLHAISYDEAPGSRPS